MVQHVKAFRWVSPFRGFSCFWATTYSHGVSVLQLNNHKKIKLMMSFMLIILLFVIVGIITVRGIYILGESTQAIYDHPLVVSNASLLAVTEVTKMHRSMKDVVLSDSLDEQDAEIRKVNLSEQKVFQQLDVIQKNILGDEGMALERQTRELFTNWKPIRAEVIQLAKSGYKKDAILITREKGAEYVSQLESKMFELTSYARNKADFFIASNEASQSKLETTTMILIVLGIVLSVLMAFMFSRRILYAETVLQDKNNALQQALDEIKTLRGIIPICMYCKKIRSDKGAWDKLEAYLTDHTHAELSHGICPDCLEIEMEKLDNEE